MTSLFTETASPAVGALREANAAMQRGDSAATAEAARRVLAYDPENVQAYWLLGLAAIETWAYGEAESALAEGVRRLPKATRCAPAS
ncbi:MAG: tetratricopeptide repeat protein [Asticcacaulis sp.]